MPAKTNLSISPSIRARRPLYVFALVVIVALAAWATRAFTADDSSSASNALTPAMRLAVGTVNLEGTDQAVDATSAAKLLPLWQLLAQLSGSGTAAPQEISAVVEEIQLNMTSAQISAIDAMSITQRQIASSTGPASSDSTGSTSVAQSAAVGDVMMSGGMPMGDAPLDGGPMPSSGSQQGASMAAASAQSSTPPAIQQVIRLLQSKLQGATQG